jgi:cell fate (sporulation/competence/biofilm development) regulator YmcA (YheA/YmcA/DUF963 family)
VFSRQKLAEAAKELADHLQLVENVKALQVGQKELADAVRALGDRIKTLETEMRATKAETLREAAKETQSTINSVQSGLYEGIKDLAVQVARLESQRDHQAPRQISNLRPDGQLPPPPE